MAGKNKIMQAVVSFAGTIDPSLGKAMDNVAGHLDKVNWKAVAVGAAVGGIAVATGKAVVEAGKYLAELGDDYNKAMNQLSASTGATGDELDALGESVKNIYAQNLGEDFNDVAEGLAATQKASDLAGEALEQATAAGFVLRDTFDYDISESARAASALMKNFNISAEEAYGLIATGAQNGADKNGDLRDTLNEYSAQFAALGLSAPETWEDLLDVCAKFEEAGYENPITVSSEASWIITSLSDAGFRDHEYDYMVQPGDALYDEATMPYNANFQFDENDLTCDAFVIMSDERIAQAKLDGSIFSDASKTTWTEFAKLAKYFPDNYIAGGADTITDFEMQFSPIMLSGSWNVGLILDDLNQMPADKQFDWATFNIPGFANAPEGFGSTMRGLYVLGNVMGIVAKDDADHEARVLDFYLYWYSQAGAQLCYEETLSNGNYVQGPSMIKGVTLSDTLNEKLAGFIVKGPVKQAMSGLVGISETTEADRPLHNDLINKFVAGEIDLDTFLNGLFEIQTRFVQSQAENAGWDFDPAT